MSWHYLPELAEEYSAATSRDGGPSQPLSSTSSAATGSFNGRAKGTSRTSQSGTTCEPSTGDPFAAWWISCLRDSPVSRSRSLGGKLRQTIRGTCGRTPYASFGRFGQSSAYWRTSQACLPGLMGTSDKFSESWPKAGSMRSGACYRLPTLELLISENACGLLPTPTASEGGRNKSASSGAAIRPSLGMMAKRGLWPTPTAADGTARGASASQYHDPRRSNRLPDALKANGVGGPLNPTWVEWLMGWPTGWTDSAPLETGKFRQWYSAFSGTQG